MKAKILWIEGKRAEGPSFIPGLRKKGYVVEMASSGKEALDRFEELAPNLVVINAASLRTTGKRICTSLRKKLNGLPILLITDSKQAVDENCASAVLAPPFTTRKLINRIEPLLPWVEETVLTVGPICLDLERRRVRCGSKEARLTPRLAQLLVLLLEHPGEVLDREILFREVWKTEYTGDTRALDVHISWLRQALEEDPRHPQFLKTVRGVGYRLDVEK